MRLPKFRYTVLVAAILGVEIPMIAMAGFQLGFFHTPEFGWLRWLPYVWPTSVFLLAFDASDPTPLSFARLAWSIGWNVLLYIIVFSLFWSLGWVFRAWRASLRNGTTI
jgi:hypothetical protein